MPVTFWKKKKKMWLLKFIAEFLNCSILAQIIGVTLLPHRIR